MKRTYELMLVLRPDFAVEDTKLRDSLLEKLLKGASIKEITVLGKKTISFPIKKQKEGIYVLVHFEHPGMKTGDIQNEARLGTDVLRFLLIQKG